MFKLEKYYGVYEDKNKNYVRTDFYSKEEAIEAFDNSEKIHEINIITPMLLYSNIDRTKFNNYFKGREMYFLSIILNGKFLIIQELRTDNKETMLGHINSYLKDIISNNESILCFRYINYDVQIDLELLKDKDGFKIIEKR